MQDYTHAFPRGNQRRHANEEANQGHDSPCATSGAKSEDDSNQKSGNDATDTQTARKDDAGAVAVADGPPDEVGVSLAAERPLDRRHDVLESGGVGGVLESMEKRRAFPR
jgi:hypothetical protein